MKYYYNKAQPNIEYGMLSSRKLNNPNVNRTQTVLLHTITLQLKNRPTVGITEKRLLYHSRKCNPKGLCRACQAR